LDGEEIAYFAHHVGKLPEQYSDIVHRKEERFERLIQSLVGSLEEQRRRKQAYWQGIANGVDYWSRCIIPGLYTAGLAALLQMGGL
ncbi:MAG: hypothetical protein SGPRY_013716, partial [Prymnesium sp.]